MPHRYEGQPRELPDRWSWTSGTVQDRNYTYRFETTSPSGSGYWGEVYSNNGDVHFVVIYPVHGVKNDGDSIIGPYPIIDVSFDSYEEAVSGVYDAADELDSRDNSHLDHVQQNTL